jgi:thymidylate kinase
MTIEFFGLSGSGKSTIAKTLANKGGYQIIRIRKKKELFYYNLLSFLRHPIAFICLFILVIKHSSGYKEFYYKFMNCFLDYNAKYEKARGVEMAILDQGYFQNIISLYDRSIKKEDLDQLRKIIRLPDILFVFELDKEKRRQRHEERGYGLRGNFDAIEQEEFTKVSEENFLFFCRQGKEVFENMIFIDASKELEDTIKEISISVRQSYGK